MVSTLAPLPALKGATVEESHRKPPRTRVKTLTKKRSELIPTRRLRGAMRTMVPLLAFIWAREVVGGLIPFGSEIVRTQIKLEPQFWYWHSEMNVEGGAVMTRFAGKALIVLPWESNKTERLPDLDRPTVALAPKERSPEVVRRRG